LLLRDRLNTRNLLRRKTTIVCYVIQDMKKLSSICSLNAPSVWLAGTPSTSTGI
jgi:hypothetical protein